MAYTYTAITEAETNPKAPGTSSLWKRWWKNPIAMFEGAVGAPRLQFEALGTIAAGSTIRSRVDGVQATSAGTDIVAMLFGLTQPGVVRLSCEHSHGGGATSSVSISFRRWRANVWTNLVTHSIPSGTGYTARSLDISVLPGDTIGVYMTGGAGGAISSIRNIRLSTDGGLLWPAPALTALE